jgi:tetratricopeptide (TPR) repeat protein
VPAPAQQKGAHEFVITASRAEQGPSPSDALESLRRALAENPGDLALEQRVREAEREADLRTKARLLLDAEAATRAQRFGEAASLYGRAAAASNSAELYFKAAECSLAADDNPRRAAEFAKSGIEIAPSDARLRLLLGRIYAESGMTRSAVTELEKARQLAPDDATIEELLRRVRKG